MYKLYINHYISIFQTVPLYVVFSISLDVKNDLYVLALSSNDIANFMLCHKDCVFKHSIVSL
jgi:hypothetical protein